MKAIWAVSASLICGLTALSAAAEGQSPSGQEQAPQRQEQAAPKQEQAAPKQDKKRAAEERHKDAKEQEVKLSEVPKPVRQAIQTHAGGGKISKIEKVTLPSGQVQYEAHVDKGGQDLEILVAPNGDVLRKGEDVAD